MTATASLTLAQVFTDLSEGLRRSDKATATLADGTVLRATRRYDDVLTLDRDGDWYGRIEYRDYRDNRKPRPDWCTGAARKFNGRDGFVWWMPPADLLDTSDPANAGRLESLADRVRGYVREDWTYTGVTLTLTPPPCAHGQLVDRSDSLWGIESDAAPEHLAEMLADLYANVEA